MDSDTTRSIGSFLGLPIPAGPRLELSVNGASPAQFAELWDLALQRGLPVQSGTTTYGKARRIRWLTIGSGDCHITLHAPDDFEDFDTFIDRKMEGLKFIEVESERMDRIGVPEVTA
jgi:hypothetical protein